MFDEKLPPHPQEEKENFPRVSIINFQTKSLQWTIDFIQNVFGVRYSIFQFLIHTFTRDLMHLNSFIIEAYKYSLSSVPIHHHHFIHV